MAFFDFHTHNKNSENAIINIFPNENIISGKLMSCGMHPWYYRENYADEIIFIEDLAKSKKIIAIGEVGFDPVSQVNLETQNKIFIEHFKISETYNLPLIIHCVKYFHVLKELKKNLNPKQAWIIHSFNSKPEILQDLQRQGFYFSFSNSIFKNSEKAKTIFNTILPERFFLESDDSQLDIKEIYHLASEYFNLEMEELKSQISKNLKHIGI
jgi:TatD DNase family protein